MRSETRVTVAVVVALSVVATAAGGVGTAQTADDWKDQLYDDVVANVGAFNDSVGGTDLGVAGDQLANHRVNLYVNHGSETAVYSFYMDGDNRIVEFQRGPHADATVKMTTDRATVERILASDRPAAAFRDAVAADEIVIAGENGHVLQQLKWAILNLLKGFLL